MTQKTFAFSLGQNISITASGETGTVIGRAEYATSENTYLIRYKAANGLATEAWWQESAIQAI